MKLRRRRADIVAFARGIAAAFTPVAERKRITLEVHAAEPAIDVAFDADALEKVLTNLLSNAFKFTPDSGRIDIAIQGGRSSDAAGAVVVRITDSGPGIRPKDLPHVFERFYHAEDAGDRSQPGTGIGLALARELVELHGGSIHAANGAEAGVTFTVSLPLEHGRTDHDLASRSGGDRDAAGADHDGAGAAREAPIRDAVTDPTRAAAATAAVDSGAGAEDVTTVLVVEDDDELRTYVRTQLGRRYRVIEAADGADGAELARARVPDVIISDVAMPEMDGYALCQTLHGSPETDFIPIILLTARAASEERIAGLQRGADDYITKPFSMRELEARIDNLIRSRRRLRERFGADRIELPSTTTYISAGDRAFIERVRSAIETNLGDPEFGVAALARAVFLDRSHLYRRCHALFGETPSELIRRVRLEQAARLLSGASGSIGKVAYSVGFASVSHFIKCFRDAYSVTPAAYRDRNAPVTHC